MNIFFLTNFVIFLNYFGKNNSFQKLTIFKLISKNENTKIVFIGSTGEDKSCFGNYLLKIDENKFIESNKSQSFTEDLNCCSGKKEQKKKIYILLILLDLMIVKAVMKILLKKYQKN